MDILTYVRTVLNLFPKTKIHVWKLVDTLRFILKKEKRKIVRMYVRYVHVHCKYLIELVFCLNRKYRYIISSYFSSAYKL